ncbi:MAG TPA: CHAT domain-containing protein [Roseiflexaceae bacterium]|nr:CHAT domain-containing protein [Roseiflexaceae bacterium]
MSIDVYDTLRLVIEPATDAEGLYFQASLQQPGIALLGGPFRQRESFRVADVQALRHAYEQHLSVLRELAAAGMPTPPRNLQDLFELGRRITAVLPETARHGIVTAVQRAQRQRRGLRIALEVTPDEAGRQVLGIPWELMVLPLTRGGQIDLGGQGFLLLNADITLVRQVQGVGRNTAPLLTQPLSVQALAAAPLDGLPIEIEPTRAALRAALSEATMDRCWFDGPGTLAALQERLRASNPQIVHLLCHGELSDTGRGERSDLLFTHSDGYTQRVTAFDLAPVLTLAPDLQLVILQACDAGATPLHHGADASDEGERLVVESVALALVRQGVPAVVAMQGKVRQDAAEEFVRICYLTLAEGGSLEAAVAAGRIAMWAAGALVDWSLPVIYQGSGLPETHTWYTRGADRIEAVLHDPTARRSLRGSVVILALVALTAGTLRWLLLPPSPLPALEHLALPLKAWALLGLAGPAIIAGAHQGVRTRRDLPISTRHAARRAQWMGAYLGYALGGVTCLVVLLFLWLIGALVFMPSWGVIGLVSSVILISLFLSYAAARSQVRSALAIMPFAPALFGPATLVLILIAALVMLIAPLGVLILPMTPLRFLLDPAPAAFVFATILMTGVLRG